MTLHFLNLNWDQSMILDDFVEDFPPQIFHETVDSSFFSGPAYTKCNHVMIKKGKNHLNTDKITEFIRRPVSLQFLDGSQSFNLTALCPVVDQN